MKVKKKVKEAKPKTKVVLELTEREAELLSALADVPIWSQQPKELDEFCRQLNREVSPAGRVSRVAVGFVRPRTFDF